MRRPRSVRLGDEAIEVGLRAVLRIDRGVIAHVVADVPAGRRIDRRQPDRVDAEALEVVEVGDDPRQVADPVAVAVGEAARVDLVHHAAPPPVVAEPRRADGRSGGAKRIDAHRPSSDERRICRDRDTPMAAAGLDNVSRTRH